MLLVCSCASSMPERLDKADVIAQTAAMAKKLIKTDSFTLTSYQKITDANLPLNIYIEGDGFAWATRNRISTNPTPKDPLALRLAAEDTSANVIYIARPCQYTSFEHNNIPCNNKFWSQSRFATVVIDSFNQALDSLVKDNGIRQMTLTGYSGGAAIAVIVAAKRNDVIALRTVAGNLDHVALSKYHSVNIMSDSLNPSDYAKEISTLPQYHFAGEDDPIVPENIIETFARTSEDGHHCVKFLKVEGVTHHSGWAEKWPDLLTKKVYCGS